MYNIFDNNDNVVDTAVSFPEACNMVDHYNRTNAAEGPFLSLPQRTEVPAAVTVTITKRHWLSRLLGL